MEKVTGIGGFFFRAENPDALTQWYTQHLGIDSPAWEQAAGTTAFAPFPKTTDYFGRPEQQWMINFRVSQQPRRDGRPTARQRHRVTIDPENYPGMGRFARLADPEGNPIQLWEPDEADAV